MPLANSIEPWQIQHADTEVSFYISQESTNLMASMYLYFCFRFDYCSVARVAKFL